MLQPQANTDSSSKLLILLLVLLGLDLAVGAWFYKAQQQQQMAQIEKQLAAISNLKAKEIGNWRQRMLDEAALLTESPFFADGVEQYLANSQLDPTEALLQGIRSITAHYHYPGVLLIGSQGRILVGYGPFAYLSEKSGLDSLVARAMNERQTVLSDLYADDRVDGIFLAVASPLFKNGRSSGQLLGAILFICDPSLFLFPLIQNWPIPSDTAESLIVRVEGEDVLFLNELRHRKGSAMQLRFNKNNPALPAAKAARGSTGILEGLDYRGKKVIAYAQPIPLSPWFLICKIDESEAFSVWRSQSFLLVFAFCGMAGLLLALVLATLQHNKKKYYRHLLTAEQKLRRNAERSGIILKGIADGIIVTDRFGKIELLNPVAEALTGCLQHDALGKSLEEIFAVLDEESGEMVESPVAKVLREKKNMSLGEHSLLVRRDGSKVPISDSAAPLHDSQGNISGVVLVFRDKTKAHTMERLIKKRLEIYEYARTHSLDDLLSKALDEICHLVDSPIGFFHFVEPDQTTLSLQQWSTKTLQDFCQAEGKGRHYDIAEAGVWVDCLRERKPVIHNDYAALPHKKGLPAGHAAVIRELVVPVLYNDKVAAILGVGNKPFDYDESDVETVSYLADVAFHVIEAKRIDEALQTSQQTSDDLVRAIPSGLFIYMFHPPDQLVLLSANPAAEKLTGKNSAQIIGQEFNTIWPEAKARGITKRFLEVVHSGTMFETEDLQYSDEHLTGAFHIRAFVIPGKRLAVTFENITGLKQSEADKEKIQAQLLQAQKMESVGRLAGGVAHDFNNMLSVILGNAEMALENTKYGKTIRQELEEIKTAALRSADLTRQLLAFARKQAISPKIINLNHAIEAMLKMLRRLIGEDIQLAWLPQTGLKSIFIDPSQIDQILANLCVNARDAIRGLGKITIETGTMSLNEDYCRDNPGFLPGEYAMLSFSDNGPGIPREHLKNIFEPFFTTKKLGEGTGLGLATVYGIVKQNGGFIKVYSEPNQGASFRIYLPQYIGEIEEVMSPENLAPPLGQGELILLVEDETAILDLNKRMLENLGYRVVATNSATEAVKLAAEHKEQLRLLLTDIIMPEMNGHDLANTICQNNPALKCLFVSGYTATVIAKQGYLPEGRHFLQKPFMKNDLALKLHQIFSK